MSYIKIIRVTQSSIKASIVSAVGVRTPITGRDWRNLQTHIFIMLMLLFLVAVVEIVGNDCLDSLPILAVQRIELTITLIIHIMSTHVPSNLGVFIHSLELLPLGVPIVLESDGVICQSGLLLLYPLELAVLFTPIIWFTALYYYRYFSFC